MSDPFHTEYLRIPDVLTAKQFFGPINADEREWRSNNYFIEICDSARSQLGIGEHDRAEAFIFGAGEYPERDNTAHDSHFPISVKVMNFNELELKKDESIDLTAHASEFPWDVGKAEVYLYVRVKRLILGNGSRIEVNGNVFILDCQKAIGTNLEPTQQANIIVGSYPIIPRDHQFDSVKEKMGLLDGIGGKDGQSLKRESTMFGPRLISGSESANGEAGANGKNGARGANGQNGNMLFLADIRFSQMEGFIDRTIKISARAAPGLPGGIGNSGGDGGNGGTGASGSLTTYGLVSGHTGGNGGNGGDGGDGGRGGNGGLACDIFVSIPQECRIIFETESFPSFGGQGGEGGSGGNGGRPGKNGAFSNLNDIYSFPINGKVGNQGKIGKSGKQRRAPKIQIFERPQNTHHN